MQKGAVTARCPLPRCHCPCCALCCSVSCRADPSSSVPRSALWNSSPCPALCVSIHTFPRHRQLEMVIPALTASLDQRGPVSSTGSGLQQLWWLQTRPQISPCWVGVTGNAKPSREQLCLHLCASVPSLLAPGWGQGLLSVSSPAARPCPLSPSPGAGAVCAPPARSPAPRSCRIAGSSPGRKRCFLWVSQEELSPLGDVMGVTSPAQTFPAVLIIFPEFSGLGACGW